MERITKQRDEETKSQRVKKTKRQRVKGTKGQRDEETKRRVESKRLKDKETKGQRDEGTKRQRDKKTKSQRDKKKKGQRQKPRKPLEEYGGCAAAVMLPFWSYKSKLLTPNRQHRAFFQKAAILFKAINRNKPFPGRNRILSVNSSSAKPQRLSRSKAE